jgi:hypothetical protein
LLELGAFEPLFVGHRQSSRATLPSPQQAVLIFATKALIQTIWRQSSSNSSITAPQARSNTQEASAETQMYISELHQISTSAPSSAKMIELKQALIT